MSTTKQNQVVTLLLSNACNRELTLSERVSAIRHCATTILNTSKEPSVKTICKNILERKEDNSVLDALDRMEKILIFSTDTEI